ncbi:hypothetical protein C8Q80DRAFT_885547 [Daedaleopsis nitida]|nr:hypothetical protein C8Q80DRAFT_885547 [Daedaleopsis nitida]
MGESEAAYRLGRSAAADEHMTQGENKQLILDMSRTAYRSSHSHAGDEDGVVVVQWNKPKRKPKKVQQPKLEPTEDVLPPAPPVSSAHPRTTSAASVVPFWDQVNPSAAPIVPFWDKASTSPSANEGDVAMDEPMPTSQSIRDVVMTSSATILDHDSLPMPSKAEMDTQHVPSVPPAAEENIGRCGASVKPEPISDEPLPALPSEREWVYTPTNTANLADFRDDPRATDEFLHGFDHEEGFYQEDGFYAEEPYAEQTTTFIPIPIPIVIVVPIFVDGSSTAPSSDAPGAKLEPVDDEDELTCDEEPIRAVAPRLLALPASVSHKAVATIDSVDGAHLVEGPSVSGDLLVFRDTPDMREDDSDDESDDESDSSDEESQTSLWSADRSLWSYRESTPVDFAEDDECSQGALSSSSSYASEINAGSRSCDLPPTLLWLANQWSMGNPSFNVQDRFIEQRLDVDSSIGLPPSASLESCDSFKSLASFDSFYTAIDWEDNSDSAMSTGDVSTNTTSTADDSADDSDASVYSLDAPGSIACDFDQYQCLGQFFAQFEVDMEHSAAITACPHAASIAPAAVLDREEYSPLKNLDDLRELSTTIESSSDYTRTKRKFFWNWGWLTVLVINALSCFVQSLTPTPTFNLPQHPTAISLYP